MITRNKLHVAGHFVSDKIRHNLVYALYWLYELRFRKTLVNNCGYFPSDINQENTTQLQLYLEVIKAADLQKTETLDICDIGCGQGHGGIFLLQHYFSGNIRYTGIDISEIAIAYCKLKYRRIKQANFKISRHGIPAKNGSYDIIFSVETSAPRFQKNLLEMYRCLKPDGLLVFFETYNRELKNDPDQLLMNSGFSIVKKLDVTTHVIDAFVHDNERKLNELKRFSFLPKKILEFLRTYTGTVGSPRFENYQTGKRSGLIYVLRRLPKLFMGYLEHWDGRQLIGWACCLENTTPISIKVLIGETVITEAVAGNLRPDVAQSFGTNYLASGFCIALDANSLPAGTIRVVYAETGQELLKGPAFDG